ncbi:MAG: preprotein translocase subunit SecE [Armatimonadota bacterium]|nr:preprotein translocase subunit SecE [Armatimonadota bacterium]
MANSVAAKGAAKAKGDGLWKRMSRFLRESWIEVIKKASWPTWAELKKSTAVVIIAVLVVAVYIGVIDTVLSKITNPLLGMAVPKK